MKPFLWASILMVTVTVSVSAQGQDKLINRTRISKQSATITGDRGLYTIPSAETLNPGQFSFGGAWNNFDRTPKDIDVNAFPVYASYGLFSRLTIMGYLETHKQVTASNISQIGYYNSLPFVSSRFQDGLGDATFAVKYRLQRKSDNVGGIALKGSVRLGTADSRKGLGTERQDFGAEVIFSSLLPWNFVIHSNVGYVYTANSRTDFDRNVRDELNTGIGAAWPSAGLRMGSSRLQGVVEYATTSFVGCCGSKNAVVPKVQNPADLAFGVRFLALNQGLTFDAGYRDNLKFDETNPNNRNSRGVVASITFTKPTNTDSSSNRNPQVGIQADNAEIAATGTATLTATGFDADNDRLIYTWTASAGQITGTGERVTYRPSGPGRHVVRVTASDGRGGTGTAEIEINVR